jgi:hypothetical protein
MSDWTGLQNGSREFLLGASHDPDSTLASLNGNRLALDSITDLLRRSFIDDAVIEHTAASSSAASSSTAPASAASFVAYKTVRGYDNGSFKALFPEPTGIDVNMMPIKLFDLKRSLPENLHGYLPLIMECKVRMGKKRYDQIVYLTVQESHVPAGESQRRPGLHIERPHGSGGAGSHLLYDASKPPSEQRAYFDAAWGLGYVGHNGIPIDGIFMANTVPGSCRVWPALIGEPERVTDAHGGIEHLRERLGSGVEVGDELIWMTDRTPHESLPVSGSGMRQFFRLVVGPISVWHANHNTANPLGTLPYAPVTHEDRFSV